MAVPVLPDGQTQRWSRDAHGSLTWDKSVTWTNRMVIGGTIQVLYAKPTARPVLTNTVVVFSWTSIAGRLGWQP